VRRRESHHWFSLTCRPLIHLRNVRSKAARISDCSRDYIFAIDLTHPALTRDTATLDKKGMGNSSGRSGTGRLLLGSAGLLLVLALFFIGPVGIVEGLYARLWPRQSPSEVATSFTEKPQISGMSQFRCEDGTDGWDYVCFAVRSKGFVVPPGPVKFGAIGGAMGRQPTLVELPIDGPTPPMEEFMRARAETAETEQTRRTPTAPAGAR
jgi:hypothetical protein